MLTQTENWRPSLERFQRLALIVGAAGAVLSVIGVLLGPAQFFYSLMFAFFFWMTLTIGASIVLMIQHLTGGVWGLMLRRMLEAAMLTLPLLAVTFVILIFGMTYLYPWMRPEEIAKSEAIQFKQPWLNQPFWILRGLLYFGILIVLGVILRRWSIEQDNAKSPEQAERIADRMARLSGPGIPIVVLVWTLAATDWGMSLEPDWFSSMYPVTFIIEGLLAVMAWGIIALFVMRQRKLLPYNVPVDRLHDLGKFLFAFTVVWAYINFSQYLIIWSGNIPEETPWHAHRTMHGWEVLAILLIGGHFFLPFFGFMSRHPKRKFNTATLMACWIVFIQIVFVFWSIMPAFYPEHFNLSFIDLTALIGLGGLWMAVWAWNLKQRPLLPPNDLRMPLLERQSAGEHGHGQDHGEAHVASH